MKRFLAPLIILVFCVSFADAQIKSQEPAAERANDQVLTVDQAGANESVSHHPGGGGPANCETFEGGSPKKGVVWCGSEPTLTFKVLAERSAPILWFSPDEQLLKKKYKIPQPLPCDVNKPLAKAAELPCKQGEYCGDPLENSSAVVYYQIRRIVQKETSTGKPFVGDVLKLDAIDKLTLKYYFYYCVDCGFGGHRHDLENIELEILIEKEKGGPRFRARVTEVIGAAHGVHWYNNRLRVGTDTVFPITILVEEGTHASAPDNDGGGTYEHKTDINKRVRDAWGLRDKLTEREWVPLFPYYLKRHTNKSRPKLENRIGSKAQIEFHSDIFANYKVDMKLPGLEEKVEIRQPEEVYELKELGSDCTAEMVRQSGNSGKFDLAGALERRGAGKPPQFGKPSSKLARLLRTSFLMEEDDNLPENVWEKALQFSYRWDQSHGFAATPPLPTGRLFNGYFVPRAHFTGFSSGSRRYGLDYLYTPSASRWAEVYVAGGIEWYREGSRRPFKFGPAWEGGVKFRFPLNIKKKLFVGVRVGIRTSPTKKFSLVAEPGGGLF